ncbi:MAG: hypothetical protein OEZ06_31895 [Myxococcales bacterium]|nr:hypothetical protein [Myxococcales bacterium]
MGRKRLKPRDQLLRPRRSTRAPESQAATGSRDDDGPIADQLAARGWPIMFLSGYAPGLVLPDRFAESVCPEKPVDVPYLLVLVAALIALGDER